MQQHPSSPADIAFGERLAFLRQSLSEADPLAAPTLLTPMPLVEDDLPGGATSVSASASAPAATRAADALVAAFHAAPPDARAAYLLRALDDAIVALDLSAQLADEFALTPGAPLTPQPAGAATPADHPTSTGKLKKKQKRMPPEPVAPTDPLYDAYRAFAASQPALQALYHYRNALATRLRLASRDIPPEVAGDDGDDVAAPEPDTDVEEGRGA